MEKKRAEGIKKIMLATEKLYEKLKKSESQRLNKEEILSYLKGISPYYSYVVTALALIKKITKNRVIIFITLLITIVHDV
mgnify:CR=1 FL=1